MKLLNKILALESVNRDPRVKNAVIYGYRVLYSIFLYLFFCTAAFISSKLFAFGYILLRSSITSSASAVIPVALLTVLVMYSSVHAFAVSDGEYCTRHFARLKGEGKKDLYHILKSPEFYIQIATVLVMSLVIPVNFGLEAVFNFFGFNSESAALWQKLLLSLAVTELFALFTAIAYKRVISEWRSKEKRIGKKMYESLIGSLAAVILPYSVSSLILSVVISVLSNAIMLVAHYKVFLPVIIAIAALTAVLMSYRYVRAFIKRRSFLKRLKKVASEAEAKISPPSKVYSSVIFKKDGYNFSLWQKGRRYDCKLICGLYKTAPMSIEKGGIYETDHRVKIRNIELFHYISTAYYSFDSEGDKILILLPTPHTVFADGAQADVGSNVEGYKIYTASSFLNAVERNCLDKF